MTQENINSLRIKKGESLLPIGSVIQLNSIEQAVMIYGRKQQQSNNKKLWDYVACPYPQGHISDETNVFFNHKQIQEVFFKGLETEGEITMRKKLDETFMEE